jgi:hypothetical protein
VLVEGEEQLKKIIFLALSDCSSDNPFQDLGMDPDIVFANNDGETQARLNHRIVERFQRFEVEGRAKLAPSYPRFSADERSQELVVDVRYVNLETTSEEELSLTFDVSGAARLVQGG